MCEKHPIRKERDSNMELLRIVAMLMVLSVHANFAAIGYPTQTESITRPLLTGWRYVWESASIVCVNLFVLLSGWYGIRFSWKGLGKLLFQALFFSVGVYALFAGTGLTAFSWKGVCGCIFLTEDLYWFVIAYAGLYLLSPLLNTFCEHTDRTTSGQVLLCFFILQSLWGWLTGNAQFAHGYSIISFCGLYVLARHIRKYPCRLASCKRQTDLAIYLLLSIVTATAGFAATRLKISGVNTMLLGYDSPMVIIASVYLLLYFSKLSFRSRAVNKIASGCFGVYLLHASSPVYFQCFKPSFQYVWQQTEGMACVALTIGLLIGFFVCGTGLDYVRARLWKGIENAIDRQKA